MKPSPKLITELKENEIFCFGSNTDGRHSLGAAKLAFEKFGAVFGKGKGMVGQSYAIPTREFFNNENKQWELRTLTLEKIQLHVLDFIHLASVHKELNFLVTLIGTGNTGYLVSDMAPLFKQAKNCDNIFLPQEFIDIIKEIEE
jgi:hypothetical protein